MLKRILYGVLGGAIMVAMMRIGEVYFLIFVTLLNGLVVYEIATMFGKIDINVHYFSVISISALLLWGWYQPYIIIAALGLIWAVLIYYSFFSKDMMKVGLKCGVMFLCIIYPTIGFSCLYLLRSIPFGDVFYSWYWGMLFLLMIWANDTFAFFIGKYMGKHKICQRISPKKTWEGFLGGFVGTYLVIYSVGYALNDAHTPYLIWFILAFSVSICAPIGDFIASALKRSVNQKESSSLLGEHGGFFDRFDSLIFSAPIVLAILWFKYYV